MGPEELDQILLNVKLGHQDSRVLVGTDTHDDAGVYLLTPDQALVQTIDFFTPVVDDPEWFGRIAAVNSLSDVYAMGARPLTALNLLGLPSGKLPPEAVGALLKGGNAVMAEAGVAILGGHSVDDPEPKMGYAVTGVVHPDHIWRNSTAKVGDRVFLTKPIGTGVVIKAIKDGLAQPQEIEAAIAMMSTLNREAADALRQVGDPSACTDVTGFGLLGHTWEMAQAAGVGIVLEPDRVPLLPGAERFAQADRFPAGSRDNLRYVLPHVKVNGQDAVRLGLLADAVTSGGLLFTVPSDQVKPVQTAFDRAGLPLYAIGYVVEGPPRLILNPE